MGFFDTIGVNSIGGGLGSAMGSFVHIIIWIIILFIGLIVAGVIVWKVRNYKKFNIPLIIVTPRSDGRVIEINEGKGGYFKSKKVGGITSFRVRRKGIGIVDIPPPPSIFLSAPKRTLILAQKGMDDYEPVLPESLSRVEIPSGKLLPILQLKAKNQDATAWAFDNEASAKQRFTFTSFWEKWQTLITMMMFIFILFLILYIQWIGMKDVVSGLAGVADALKSTTQPIITEGG